MRIGGMASFELAMAPSMETVFISWGNTVQCSIVSPIPVCLVVGNFQTMQAATKLHALAGRLCFYVVGWDVFVSLKLHILEMRVLCLFFCPFIRRACSRSSESFVCLLKPNAELHDVIGKAQLGVRWSVSWLTLKE